MIKKISSPKWSEPLSTPIKIRNTQDKTDCQGRRHTLWIMLKSGMIGAGPESRNVQVISTQ